ncbi:MAG: NnrS family protein [Rhizobiaceae bacterium]|nr:NnrS family protein [Rhizobiaceae bacterium]
MLFGYLAAVMAGFILTAVPNWSGRSPINGWPLAGLLSLWIAGRVAMAFVADPFVMMAVDLAFSVALAAVFWREVIAGRNWHKAPIAGMLTLFGLANASLHADGAAGGAGGSCPASPATGWSSRGARGCPDPSPGPIRQPCYAPPLPCFHGLPRPRSVWPGSRLWLQVFYKMPDWPGGECTTLGAYRSWQYCILGMASLLCQCCCSVLQLSG